MLLLILSYLDSELDKKLFEDMYYDYRKQMTSYAMTFLTSQDDAEDAVHNVFLRIAQKNWDTVREIDNVTDLRNYLLKSTKNACLNVIKINKHDSVSLDDTPEEALYSNADLSNDNFANLISDHIEYEQVVEAIKLLSDTYKDALYYHLVMEFPVEKTSKLLGQSISTTKKQLVRGKKILLASLASKGVSSYVNE